MPNTGKAVAKLVMGVIIALAVLGGTGVAPVYAAPKTPIRHVVVIFQENVSFDHYFATYPKARNVPGEPAFHAASGTPSVNGLSGSLLVRNPNSHAPIRLSRAQNYTCDQDHDYTPEQQAFDGGLMDKFVQFTGVGGPGCPDYGFGTGLVMGYYDGNTVTALWNYAQHFAMNDNSYDTEFGPSTVGALNLVSGQTAGVNKFKGNPAANGEIVGRVVIGDPDPLYDDCGSPDQVGVVGPNIGDLLNAQGLTWGWFEGGFTPSKPASTGSPAECGSQTPNLGGVLQTDYSPHHEPFQYYPQSSNPHHLPPSSVAKIGHTDRANHQYDLTDFWKAVNSGNMPAVSFLKAKRSQDGHASYSSPLDEQIFLVQTLNALQQRPEWSSTVVFILWDDSDGWYDHQLGPIVNQSVSSADALNAPGHCGSKNSGGIPARCGYGMRLPFLVISPFAKSNFVDSTTTDQTSVIRFIEDNWGLGRLGGQSFDALAGPVTNMLDFSEPRTDILILDADTGQPVEF
jgi:phospholipase C